MEKQANTTQEEYPWNLLNEIANSANDISGEWEGPLPSDFHQTLAYVLAGLTEREQTVIDMRFKRQMTYEQVGREYKITRERVRQIEAKAIRKLRHPSRIKLLIRGVLGWVEDAREMGRQETISKELWSAIDGILKIADALKTDPTAAAKIDAEKYRDVNPANDIPIEEACLSVRALNVLKRSGFTTLRSVCTLTWDELTRLRNMGKKSAEEIVKELAEHGMKLRG